jgi:hypothetical protein
VPVTPRLLHAIISKVSENPFKIYLIILITLGVKIMASGYVYVLINPSFIDMVKIGKTSKEPITRAKEIYKTGVPTPFTVAFELFLEDYAEIEKEIHKKLAEYRVNPNREFFRIPLRKAIEMVQSYAHKSESLKVDILEQLKTKYGQLLNPDVVSVRLTQTKERVSVEITIDEAPGSDILNEVVIKRDLNMIVEENEEKVTLVFNPNSDYEENVQKYINSRPSIHFVTYPELFIENAEDALKEIEKEQKTN